MKFPPPSNILQFGFLDSCCWGAALLAVSNSSCGSADVSTTKHCALCRTKQGAVRSARPGTKDAAARSDLKAQELKKLTSRGQTLAWWRNSIRLCEGRGRGWPCEGFAPTWTSSSPPTGTSLTRGGVMRMRMKRGRMKGLHTSRLWEVDKVHSFASHLVTTHYRFFDVLSAQIN